MAKAENFVSPANLWGRPLPGASSTAGKEKKDDKKEKGATRMRTDEYDDDDDVDAELEADAAGADINEIEDDSEAYAEAAAEYDDESDEDIRETAATLADEEPDDDEDETEYEPEEGDEVSAEDVDSTAEADEDDPVESPNATKTTKRKVKDMAEKKSGADHIRDEIARRQESGDSLRGVDIVAALAKKRVTVSPAQVSQLLKKAGAAPGKRGAPAGEERSRVAAMGKKKPVEPPRSTAKRPAAGPTGSGTLPMAQLKAASDFLAACGDSYETAGEILAAHKQLGAMMGR
ncbi:hypothetical protein EBZ80_13810 [bacterium]|nr:hypothetical protein [Betaproteobacteria bacterium]NDE15998.1 hypothetical protein [bacterium]